MAAFMQIERNQRVFRDRPDVLRTYDEENFYRRFRLTKSVFVNLCDELRHELEHSTNRNNALSPELQLACALCYYATGSYQTVIGDTLNVSQPSINRIITRVSTALTNRLHEYVKYPNAEGDLQKQLFYNIAGFPGVVGCVDGTHIRIKWPKDNPVQYYNRKCYYSINVMGICDANRKFTYIAITDPGSAHDSRVLKNSHLFAKYEAGEMPGILLGDSGYPCKNWLMTPVRNVATSAEGR
jgi:nuclease HARBI1